MITIKLKRNPALQFAAVWSIFLVLSAGFLPQTLAQDEPPADAVDAAVDAVAAVAGNGVAAVAASVPESHPVSFGQLMSCSNNLRGTVKVLAEKTVEVTLTSYDGQGQNAWFVGMMHSATKVNGAAGSFHAFKWEKEDCGGSQLHKNKPLKKEHTFVLETPLPVGDYRSIGVFDFEECRNYGHVMVEKALLVGLPASAGGGNCPTGGQCSKDEGSSFEKCFAPMGRSMNETTNTMTDGSASLTFSIGFGLLASFGLHLFNSIKH